MVFLHEFTSYYLHIYTGHLETCAVTVHSPRVVDSCAGSWEKAHDSHLPHSLEPAMSPPWTLESFDPMGFASFSSKSCFLCSRERVHSIYPLRQMSAAGFIFW